ncbi:unnamed protein product [Diplocarpon coronariae]
MRSKYNVDSFDWIPGNCTIIKYFAYRTHLLLTFDSPSAACPTSKSGVGESVHDIPVCLLASCHSIRFPLFGRQPSSGTTPRYVWIHPWDSQCHEVLGTCAKRPSIPVPRQMASSDPRHHAVHAKLSVNDRLSRLRVVSLLYANESWLLMISRTMVFFSTYCINTKTI